MSAAGRDYKPLWITTSRKFDFNTIAVENVSDIRTGCTVLSLATNHFIEMSRPVKSGCLDVTLFNLASLA